MQVPGEILEVLAEKLVYAAHQLLQSTAELKRKAFLAASGSRLSEDATTPNPSSAVNEKSQSLKVETEMVLQVALQMISILFVFQNLWNTPLLDNSLDFSYIVSQCRSLAKLKELLDIVQELGTLSKGAVEGTHSSQDDDLVSLHKLIMELSGARHREID